MQSLFIDRIALVYYVSPSHEYSDFLNYLWSFQNDSPNKVWKTKYATKAMVRLSTSFLYLQIGYSHYKGYVKFDFKPHAMTVADWAQLHIHLDALFESGYQSLIEKGLVTYIEIATDIPNMTAAELFPFDQRLTNSYRFPKPPAPPDPPTPWDTVYLGHKSSGRSTCVYDKTKHLKAKGIKTKGQRTRIEARRKKLGLTISTLKSMPNPFATVGICPMSAVEAAYAEPQWQEFLTNALRHGPQIALGLAGKRRKEYVNRLKTIQSDWWNPATLWESFLAAVDALLHPPAESDLNPMGKDTVAAPA